MTAIKAFEELEAELKERFKKLKPRLVTVSGQAGVGTTTLAKALADRFGLTHRNAGIFFREEASKRGLSIYEFMAKLDEIGNREGRDFDLEWDKHTLELAFREANLLVEGRLAGLLLKDIAKVRILVECDARVVAERVAKREGKSFDEAYRDVTRLNIENRVRYEQKYGIDPTNHSHYSIVLDNSGPLEQSLKKLFELVEKQLE